MGRRERPFRWIAGALPHVPCCCASLGSVGAIPCLACFFERARENRRIVKQGLNPRFNAQREVPSFEQVAQQVHIDRMPT